MKTQAVFFPFDLFGGGGAAEGVKLLADAIREMLADGKRERQPSRARHYARKVSLTEIPFTDLQAYQDWRARGRAAAQDVLKKNDFLLWFAGNHLAALPLYEELAGDTLVVQFDAHLDVYNLSDCQPELSHGNFLLHANGPLPRIVNVGNRELLLPKKHIGKYFGHTISSAELALDPQLAVAFLKEECRQAGRVFIDIDCDVIDPAAFPAVGQPVPFGLSGQQLLRLIDACWSGRVIGIGFSEFDPARDQRDHSLAFLLWLIEYILLRTHTSD